MRIPAYAKINLFLDVMAKRQDGFHDVKTVMHRVTLCDYLTAEKCEGDECTVSIVCPTASVPLGDDNLISKAAKLFFKNFGIEKYCVKFTLEKNIPIAAGLAGGSADAAAAISLLNELYGVFAPVTKLCGIGAELGSDIPFCIAGRTSLATGRGEILHELESKLDLIFVIAKGGEGISTPAAYKKIDETYGDTLSDDFGNIDGVITAVCEGNTDTLICNMYNTFESVVLPTHREASEAKRIMTENGALGAMLSGSGPSVFGIFRSEDTAHIVRDILRQKGYEAHVCRSL